MRYAGFWKRFCATLVDGIIVNIIASLSGFILGFILGMLIGSSESSQALAKILGGILGIAISWLYFASMESSSEQATLGKQALGIKVTNLEGKPISFEQATGRHFAKILSTLILLVGYIMAAFTKKKQALHDILASTLVVS